MKFLKNLDRLVNFVIGNIAGILLIVMMIMVNVTIFSRWVLILICMGMKNFQRYFLLYLYGLV